KCKNTHSLTLVSLAMVCASIQNAKIIPTTNNTCHIISVSRPRGCEFMAVKRMNTEYVEMVTACPNPIFPTPPSAELASRVDLVNEMYDIMTIMIPAAVAMYSFPDMNLTMQNSAA